MAEEQKSNGDEKIESAKQDTSINSLVEEVERLLREVEDKKENNDSIEEEKKIIEPVTKKKENKKEIERKKIEQENEKKDLITIKGETKELTITQEQLEKIENEIRKQKDIPKQEKDNINKKIFKNIFISIIIVLYFMVVILGFFKLKEETYLNDLRVFSGILIGVTIFIFEKAYRNENIEYTILGIEILFLSIATLFANYLYIEFYYQFPYILNTISMLFAIYYVGKSIAVYIKMKKAALKKISDIRNIIIRSK